MCNRIEFATLALLLSCAPASAQVKSGDLSAGIDGVFSEIDGGSQPGCAAGVIHDGEYIHAAGYGLANLEYGIPIRRNTVFRTGSVSKQFTAMAIAILAERGDLDLDADVHEYLPDLMDYGHEVTIRQMIHHLAGMGDYDAEQFGKADGSEFRFGNEDYLAIEEFYEVVTQVPLGHEPGSKWQYSNLGYFLLSQVVERASGKTLRQFADDEIFGPLGMKASLFNDNVNQPVANRADGYRRMEDGSYEIFMTNLSWVGDGGVYTNLDDFIAWDRNFYNNKLGKGGEALITTVTTPHPDADGYAFGLGVSTQNGDRVIAHSGGWVAFSAYYRRYPDLALSVAVFCNTTAASAPRMGAQIAELALARVKGQQQ